MNKKQPVCELVKCISSVPFKGKLAQPLDFAADSKVCLHVPGIATAKTTTSL